MAHDRQDRGPGALRRSRGLRGRAGVVLALGAAILAFQPGPARSEEEEAEPAAIREPSVTELARQDQNPITRFYVMRLEDNVQLGVGPHDEAVNFFRIQPLIPIPLSRDWTLLTRVVVPIVHQPWPRTKDGLGDLSLVAFLTPRQASRFVWGLGPALLLPTATDKTLGAEKWAAGPGVSAVYTGEVWVVGVLAQHLWSFTGDDEREDVRIMTLRPLVNFNLPRGWYLTSSPSIIANWEADASDRWLVPVGGGVGKVFKLAGQRLSSTLEAYYHVESPAIGPQWQLRLQLSLLYPD
ncbi:MAG: neuromedin U [Myxococcota bacterium]